MGNSLPSSESGASPPGVNGGAKPRRPSWHAAVAAAVGLRYVLFIAFTLIATIPVVILGVWVERSALQKELDSVAEKHLLLAKNLTGSLSRYARDVESAFAMSVRALAAGQDRNGLAMLLADLNFEHLCLVEADGRISAFLPVGVGMKAPDTPMAADMLAKLRAIAGGSDRPAFSGAMEGTDGKPTIFLVQALPEGRLAFGAMLTDYIREVQRAIAFGAQGHAAIVDKAGAVLAHPNPAWVQGRMNLSKLPVVQRMMAGETGVTTFYSPAVKADMVAGYTAVPRTGWGVMVPQPVGELVARANDVRDAALLIIVLGLGSVTVVSWFLAKRLTDPVQAVASAAHDLASGNLGVRVGKLSGLMPRELRSLADAFDHMAGEVSRKSSALAEAADRAETANRAKSAFLANMSHELRTPLNAIMGFSEMMRSKAFGALPARYEAYAADIHASGAHLLQMINEILDFTKVDAGAVRIEIGEVDVPRAVASALRMIQPLADAKGLKLEHTIEPGIEILMNDATRIRQVLLNLLGNAVKFTPAGGVIKVSAAPEPDGGARLVVSDNGIGIAPEDIPTVMLPFGQAATALVTQKSHGTGLGLPLTHRLVGLMGGRFELKSAPGEGTTVTIILPSLAGEAVTRHASAVAA